jgi:hypothetical protein
MDYRFLPRMIIAGCLGLLTFDLSFSQQTSSSESPAEHKSAQVPDRPTNPNAAATDQPKPAPAADTKLKATVPGKRRTHKASVPDGTIRKVVVRQGGVDEPSAQIVQGMTPEEAARQRQNTEQLLNSTNEALQRLATRPLDAQQQETVSQIRNYINGSRSALKESDFSRAGTLASKAYLLAEDLEKNRSSAHQ